MPGISIATGLVVAFALIFGTAFFVAAEFALLSVPRGRLENRVQSGSRPARVVQRAIRELSLNLSSAQLGITATSIALGFVAEPTVASMIDPLLEGLRPSTKETLTFAVALFLATVVHMVLGELVPKNLAIAHPLGVAIRVGPALAYMTRVARPLVHLLNRGANRTVRLFGITPREELNSIRSLEELELLVRSSAAQGDLDPEEAALLARSIDFGKKTADEIMTPRVEVEGVEVDRSVADLAALAAKTGHSRFPLYREDLDHIEGVLHAKDVFGVNRKDRTTTPVSAIKRDAVVVPESQPLDTLLRVLRTGGGQLAIVVDEYGGTAGVVSLEDVIEEIVGEIEDEYDDDAPSQANNLATNELPGSAHRYDYEEVTGSELPEGRFETVAGFVMAALGRVPRLGDIVTHDGWSIEVVDMEGLRVERVRLYPLAEDR